jgi:L-threonylcarbamoyladenylate synthase
MNQKTISIQDPDSLNIALSALLKGEVIVIPTDTVYGLACLASNTSAIEKIYQSKGRDFSKALPVIISHYSQLSLIADKVTDAAKKVMDHFWPGALTLVIPKHHSLPPALTSLPTVGVRMPNHPWLLELINHSGPLASTSANISGAKSPVSVAEAVEQLQGKVIYFFDGGPCIGGISSTVVDFSKPDPVLLREGQITYKEIQTVVNS